MRTEQDRAEDLSVGRLVEAYDEYIALLAESEASLIGLAYAHGFRCPGEKVEQGKRLRERIAELKRSLKL